METCAQVPHVVIIGAGFAGLNAVKSLAHEPVRVTLIDKHNYHLFQPLLYQVATSGLASEDISSPIRMISSQQKNMEFILAEVTTLDIPGKTLSLDTGQTVDFDYLIIACGGINNFFGITSIAQNALGLKSLDEAIAIRSHVLQQFETADALHGDRERQRNHLTFTIVGGGPTGVELAGAFAELMHNILRKDFPRLCPEDFRIILLEAGPGLLPQVTPDLQANTKQALEKRRIEIRLSTSVTDFDGQTVTLKDGEQYACHTLIWGAGVRANELLDTLHLPQGHAKRLIVSDTLQIAEYPYVFAVGDTAHREENGRPLPMTAVVAIQEGIHASKVIGRLVRGQQPEPFHFRDKGTLATIGRSSAVGIVGNYHLKGWIAWFLWMSVHILQIVTFNNRWVIFWKWFWNYFYHDFNNRIIMHRHKSYKNSETKLL